MHSVSLRSRWVTIVGLGLLCLATAAYGDTTVSLTDPSTWWAWLQSRIGVPGG